MYLEVNIMINKQEIIQTIDSIFHELNHGSNYGMCQVLNKHYDNWQYPQVGKVGIDDLFLI